VFEKSFTVQVCAKFHENTQTHIGRLTGNPLAQQDVPESLLNSVFILVAPFKSFGTLTTQPIHFFEVVISIRGLFFLKMSVALSAQCTHCLKATRQRCTGCKIAYYCCVTCQNADWSLHRVECKTKGSDYDEGQVCAQLVARVMNSRDIRDRFATTVRQPPPGSPVVHGVAIRCNDAVEARMALRDYNVDLHCNFLTRADQYMKTPPISVTGMRPGKDYVVVIEVKQHNGPLYASNAMAVPLDFDEPGQPITLVPPPAN